MLLILTKEEIKCLEGEGLSKEDIAILSLVLVVSPMERLMRSKVLDRLIPIESMEPPAGIVFYLDKLAWPIKKKENDVAATKQEALGLIDQARLAMVDALKLADDAKKASTEAGILTANEIISEGIEEISYQAMSQLPSVASYVGGSCTEADVRRLSYMKDQVIATANVLGKTVAMLVKVAVRAMV